jgi:hypothetical protein
MTVANRALCASRRPASVPLAENRCDMRSDVMHDRRAAGLCDRILHIRVAAENHGAVGRIGQRFAVAGTEHRIVLLEADHRKHVEAEGAQVSAFGGPERVDRILFNAHRRGIDQLLLGKVCNELMARLVTGERRVKRGRVAGERQGRCGQCEENGQKNMLHKLQVTCAQWQVRNGGTIGVDAVNAARQGRESDYTALRA